MADDFFEDDFSDVDPDVYDNYAETDPATNEDTFILGDPLMVAVALGLGEEIGLEQRRLSDGEPLSRIDRDIEKVSVKAVKKSTENGSFFEYVLNRCEPQRKRKV